MRKASFLLLLLISSTATVQATLVTVFNDYGSPASFDSTFGDTVVASGNVLSPSFAFTVPGSLNLALNEIIFTASMMSVGGVNSVTVSIEKDNGGVPGTQVYTSGPIVGQMGVLSSSTNPPVTIDYSTMGAGTSLTAGATYWLTLTAPSTAQVAWNANGPGTIGTEEFMSGGVWTSSSKELGAFEIIGATPEPSTWILLGGGLTLMIAGRRRFSNK